MLDPARVPTDQLHPHPRHAQVEHPGVGGVGQPQPHHLPRPSLQPQVGVPTGQEHVAEAAHGRIAGLSGAEGGHLAVLEQQVVHRQDHVPVHRRPIVRLGRDDQDVAVQAKLLGVVLPDMGVIPVQPRIGELNAVGEVPTYRDRRLGLVRHPVVAVLQPQPVPVHGGVQVPLVDDVDDDLAALLDLEGGAGDGAVVAQHSHPGVAQPLGHRRKVQVEGVAVGQLQQLGPASLGEPGRVGGERLGGQWVGPGVVLHAHPPGRLTSKASADQT
jgi:hypothetical protein